MIRGVPAVAARVGEDDPGTDARRRPSSVARDPLAQSNASVHRPDQFGRIHQQGLEFDDQQALGWRVPRHDVDGSALAKDRERDLRHPDPAKEFLEPSQHRTLERRMGPVDEPVQLWPTPAWRDVHPHLEGPKHLAHGRQRHVLQCATLQTANLHSTNSGSLRYGRLGHAPADPDCPACSAELRVIHLPILASARYAPLTADHETARARAMTGPARAIPGHLSFPGATDRLDGTGRRSRAVPPRSGTSQ